MKNFLYILVLGFLFLTSCMGVTDRIISANLSPNDPTLSTLSTQIPYPTYTPLPTYTPYPTYTREPTYTSVPTNTDIPYTPTPGKTPTLFVSPSTTASITQEYLLALNYVERTQKFYKEWKVEWNEFKKYNQQLINDPTLLIDVYWRFEMRAFGLDIVILSPALGCCATPPPKYERVDILLKSINSEVTLLDENYTKAVDKLDPIFLDEVTKSVEKIDSIMDEIDSIFP